MQTGHKKIRFKVNINYIKQKYYYYKAIKLDINKYEILYGNLRVLLLD